MSAKSQASTLLLIALVVAITMTHATTVHFNTDCMKNPFATGCRGISAKRSVAQSTAPPAAWRPVRPALDEYELNRLLGAAVTSMPISERRRVEAAAPPPIYRQQLMQALELLTDAAGHLLACDAQFQQQKQQQCRSQGDGDRAATFSKSTNNQRGGE